MMPPTVLVETKAWYKSRTVWVSVIATTIPILTYIGDNAFQLGLPDQAIPWLALGGFGLTTLTLRFKTDQPIATHDGDLIPLPGARLPDPPISTVQDTSPPIPGTHPPMPHVDIPPSDSPRPPRF